MKQVAALASLLIVALLVVPTIALNLTPQAYLPYQAKAPQPTATNTLQPTPTATPLPTSTPIPTPTSTPPPSPTPQPSGIYILPQNTTYTDSIDYLHVIGEVHNNTGQAATFVRVAANFFNAAGQLVDTDYTYLYLDILPHNERSCFHILTPRHPDYAYHQFEPVTYHSSSDILPNLTVLNDSAGVDPIFGWYYVIGQVRNDHGIRIEYVQPVITLYNNAIPLDCGFTYVNSTHLDPGQTSSFEDYFTGRPDYADVTAYRIQVGGNIP